MILRSIIAVVSALSASACLTPGDEPYAGWRQVDSSGGGFSLRYLAPPWELDLAAVAPAVALEVPFQHAAPVGLPDPPPSYYLLATPGPAAPTDALSAQAEAARALEGDSIVVTTRPLTTRSGLAGHEMISIDVYARFHRESFIALPSAAVVHVDLESNDDADARDVDDLVRSLEALE